VIILSRYPWFIITGGKARPIDLLGDRRAGHDTVHPLEDVCWVILGMGVGGISRGKRKGSTSGNSTGGLPEISYAFSQAVGGAL